MLELKDCVMAQMLLKDLTAIQTVLNVGTNLVPELAAIFRKDPTAKHLEKIMKDKPFDLRFNVLTLNDGFVKEYVERTFDEGTWAQLNRLKEVIREETLEYTYDFLKQCSDNLKEQKVIEEIIKKMNPEAYLEADLFLPLNFDSLYAEKKERFKEIIGELAEHEVFKDRIKLLMYATIIYDEPIRKELGFELYGSLVSGGYPNRREGWLHLDGLSLMGERSSVTMIIKFEALSSGWEFLTIKDPGSITAVMQNQATVHHIKISSGIE